MSRAAPVQQSLPHGDLQSALQVHDPPADTAYWPFAELTMPRFKKVLVILDAMTDIIPSFWAIALCEITGIRFREIMGYCVAMWISYLYTSIACLLVPLGL